MVSNYLYESLEDFFNKRYAENEEVRAEKKDYAVYLLQKYLPPTEAKNVLDLGCGTGLYTIDIKNLGYSVTGADLSPVAIDKLRKRGIDGFCWNAANKIAVEDDSFDAVIALDLIELLPDPFLFFSEVRRVLKPNGYFIFSTPNLAWWPFRLKSLLGYTNSDVMPRSHTKFWSTHGCRYFLDNDFFRLTFEGGVITLPNRIFKSFSRIRSGRRPFLSREIVGVAQVINK